MARYWMNIHLCEPIGREKVAKLRDAFAARAVEQFRSFNPKPETAGVRYVRPSKKGFRDRLGKPEPCPMSPPTPFNQPCTSAHVVVSVVGRAWRPTWSS